MHRASIIPVIAVVSLIMASTAFLPVALGNNDNYYSSVIKISRTYSSNHIHVSNNIDDHKTVSTGAMELQYFLSRNYTTTNDWVSDAEFTFESLWAYSVDINDQIDLYYVYTSSDGTPLYEYPAKIMVKNYRLRVQNTYYTWGRDYLQEVVFNSNYVYDEDTGDQTSDYVINVILDAMSAAWDFTWGYIGIPLPAPWQVLQNTPGSNGINVPVQVDFNHNQINDINSHYDFNLPPLNDNQHYRRNLGLKDSVRIEYDFSGSTTPTACGIVFLWSFQSDVHITDPIGYIDYLDVPQGNEPILFAYVTHNIYFLPPTGAPIQ